MFESFKQINIAFESLGILVCMFSIAVIYVEAKIDNKTRKCLLSLFLCLSAYLWCDMLGLITKGSEGLFGQILVRVMNFGEFFLGFFLSFLFTFYILHRLGGEGKKEFRIWYIIAFVTLFSSELLVIVSQFTGWIYTIDEKALYHRGEFYWLCTLSVLASLVPNIIVLIKNKKYLPKKEYIAFGIYIGVIVSVSIATHMFYGISFNQLGCVISAVVMLMVILKDQVGLIKKSIKIRINYLISSSLTILSIFFIFFILIVVHSEESRSNEIMMRKTCNAQTLRVNNQLKTVELAVRDIYAVSEQFRPSIEELKDEEISLSFIDQMQQVLMAIADNTEGVIAVYYRLNPDITGHGRAGFFAVKSKETGKFELTESTDILKYDTNDIEHVGWYYLPVWAGKPTWMEPYYNANVGEDMISYVIPIFDENELIGVIGMDIDFDKLKATAEDIDIYESDGAVLASMSNGRVYYKESDLFGDYIPEELHSILQNKENSDKIIFINIDDEDYAIYFVTLDNSLKFITYVKASELHRQLYTIIMTGLAVFTIIFAITLYLSLQVIKKIVKPLTDITESTKKFAQGDWYTEISCDTEDEMKELTDSIQIMADKTKEYIAKLKDVARTDTLTGLRNRNDYLTYIEHINKNIHNYVDKLAVVVLDVNNLKEVNDHLGHEKGDELLQKTGAYIRNMFVNSAAFRIGGDEFVVIVDGADYERIEDIMENLQHHMKLTNNSKYMMKINIASGMAKLDVFGLTFNDIFKEADERMYDNKKQLKMLKCYQSPFC